MGVDFYCGDYVFHSSYSGWDEIRRQIMKSTFDFVSDKFAKDQLNYANVDEDDEDYIGENSSYYRRMNEIKQLIACVESNATAKPNNNVFDFVRACNECDYFDTLIYFDINGLYALCNKSDCEGYYSHGNSTDICHLLDLIKPFIKANNEYVYERIYEDCEGDLYRLFAESATKKLIVTIC